MIPVLERFDHVHVHVTDREAAREWYARVLGLRPLPGFLHWAEDGGPLTIGNPAGSVHLALFQREAPRPRKATIALAVTATEFGRWGEHLERELGTPPAFEDHGESWSLYFADPDGNPYEITCYEVQALRGL